MDDLEEKRDVRLQDHRVLETQGGAKVSQNIEGLHVQASFLQHLVKKISELNWRLALVKLDAKKFILAFIQSILSVKHALDDLF